MRHQPVQAQTADQDGHAGEGRNQAGNQRFGFVEPGHLFVQELILKHFVGVELLPRLPDALERLRRIPARNSDARRRVPISLAGNQTRTDFFPERFLMKVVHDPDNRQRNGGKVVLQRLAQHPLRVAEAQSVEQGFVD